MILQIILALLTISIITGLILLYIWWKKYGKKLFNTITDLTKLTSTSGFKNPNDLFGEFDKMFDGLKKFQNAKK